jgi:hypothetical protein
MGDNVPHETLQVRAVVLRSFMQAFLRLMRQKRW